MTRHRGMHRVVTQVARAVILLALGTFAVSANAGIEVQAARPATDLSVLGLPAASYPAGSRVVTQRTVAAGQSAALPVLYDAAPTWYPANRFVGADFMFASLAVHGRTYLIALLAAAFPSVTQAQSAYASDVRHTHGSPCFTTPGRTGSSPTVCSFLGTASTTQGVSALFANGVVGPLTFALVVLTFHDDPAALAAVRGYASTLAHAEAAHLQQVSPLFPVVAPPRTSPTPSAHPRATPAAGMSRVEGSLANAVSCRPCGLATRRSGRI